MDGECAICVWLSHSFHSLSFTCATISIAHCVPGDCDVKRILQAKVDISLPQEGDQIALQRIYLKKIRRQQKQDIWVVNGSRIRSHIFDEFLEGGNDERYRFV